MNPLSWLNSFQDQDSGESYVNSNDCDPFDEICDVPSTLRQLLQPNVDQLKLSFINDDILEDCLFYTDCDNFDHSTKTKTDTKYTDLSTDVELYGNQNVDNCIVELNEKKIFQH